MPLILQLCISIILFLPISALGEASGQFVETTEKGRINWSIGAIKANGLGSPDENCENENDSRKSAVEAARLDGLKNLIETIKYIRIDGENTIQDFAENTTGFMDGISHMVKNAAVVNQTFFSNGSAKVEVQLDLYGGFAQFVLPREITQVDSVKTMSKDAPEKKKLGDGEGKTEPVKYTGLVINAGKISAEPAMVPAVVDGKGKEIYGPAFVSREFAVQKGMSAYFKTIAAALSDERVGKNPLILKGLKVQGPGYAKIVISNKDASKLIETSDNLLFLKQCRVAIVIN